MALSSALFFAENREAAQDRHRRHAHEKHSQFHDETGNDQRAIGFHRGEGVAHDLFDRNIDELRAAFRLAARAFCDVPKFGVDRPRAKRDHADAGAAELGAQRFGETVHVGFACCVNGHSGNREKTGR